MKRTRRLLRKKWDKVFYNFIRTGFDKFEKELGEHAALMK